MTVTCQVERFADFAEEIASLVQGHQAEADLLNEHFPRTVRLAVFHAIEATGTLLAVTLRVDGILAGYAGGIVAADPQRTAIDGSDVRICSEVGVYVAPAYRGHGFALTRAFEREAIARGAKLIYLRGPTGSRASRFFEALGYRPVETTFAKVVTDAGTLLGGPAVPS